MLNDLASHRRLTGQYLLQLRELREFATQLSLDETTERISSVIQRVEEDVFRIAVVGEFKRGKSTLINALLGKEILPADVLPCSATLNRVTYGLTPSVRLVFKPDEHGDTREDVIAIDQLADYVTKLTPDSEERSAQLQEAVVHYPIKYCKDKADIIDTPGLNDDAAMTDVTMSVLPHVDAALLVILAQAPFAGSEAAFLNRMLSQDIGRVIFVVNRMDEIRRPRDRKRILEVVRARIKDAVQRRAVEQFGEGTPELEAFLARVGEPKVFGVSGGLALDAKLEDDAELLDESGFPVFEQALEQFLTTERGAITLTIMTDAATSGAAKLLRQAALRQAALEMEAGEFERRFAEVSGELAVLRGQFTEQRRHIDESAAELQAMLRPLAQKLPARIQDAARQAVDGYPLTAAAVSDTRLSKTAEKLMATVTERVQIAIQQEMASIQGHIEQKLNSELSRLSDYSRQLAGSLAALELKFTGPPGELGVSSGTAVAASAAASALGGPIFGGLFSGALSGYEVAGVKGAAAGAASGVVVTMGVTVAGLIPFALLGLPLSWPVTLPALAIAGISSSLGTRWATRQLFGQATVERFREQYRQKLLAELERVSHTQIRSIQEGIDKQVRETFAALRKNVSQELGGPIEQTQRTLDELRTQTTRSEAQREREQASLERLVARTQEIAQGAQDLAAALRTVQASGE